MVRVTPREMGYSGIWVNNTPIQVHEKFINPFQNQITEIYFVSPSISRTRKSHIYHTASIKAILKARDRLMFTPLPPNLSSSINDSLKSPAITHDNLCNFATLVRFSHKMLLSSLLGTPLQGPLWAPLTSSLLLLGGPVRNPSG